jgi:hypothetical protein
VLDLVDEPHVILERHYLLRFRGRETTLEHAFVSALAAHHAAQVAQGSQPEIDQPELVGRSRMEEVVDEHRLLAGEKTGCYPLGKHWVFLQELGDHGKIRIHDVILSTGYAR